MNNNYIDSNFLQTILDHVGDGVYFVDCNRNINYWNKGAENITGYMQNEVIGMNCADNLLKHINCEGKELCHNHCPLMKAIREGVFTESEVFLHHKNGHRVPVKVRVNPMYDKNNEIVGAVETFSDIHTHIDLKKKMDVLEQKVYLDDLTQLPNRRFLECQLNRQHNRYLINKNEYGVIFIDIDHFKNVNDLYGHDVGDQVLAMTSNTLKLNFRSVDYIGRWGGEEFMGIIPDINMDVLYEISDRTRLLVSKSELKYEPMNINITISVGATLIREDDDINSIVNRADQCLYKSKNTGRNRVTLE